MKREFEWKHDFIDLELIWRKSDKNRAWIDEKYASTDEKKKVIQDHVVCIQLIYSSD